MAVIVNKDLEYPFVFAFKHDILSKLKTQQFVMSRKILVDCCPKSDWCTLLYPRGCYSSEHVSVFLCRACTCTVRVKFSLKLTHLSFKAQGTLDHVFQPHEPRWGFPKLTTVDNLFKGKAVLSDDVLLFVEIAAAKQADGLSGSVTDAKKLMTTTALADVTIHVGGREFQAHKALLSARSEFLAQKLLINPSYSLTLHNISATIFNEILKFIYTDTCPNLEIFAEEILAASYDLKIKSLSLICEKELIQSLDVNNVVIRLGLSRMYKAGDLKEKSLKFLIDHSSEFSSSVKWGVIAETKPELITEAFLALIEFGVCYLL